MGVFDLARADWQRFTQEVLIKFRPTSSDSTTDILGLATKHHKAYDFETGQAVNSKQAHCSVSESLLADLGYTVRNAGNEVLMINHLVTYADSTGIEANYKINQVFPDESNGMITFILGDYE